MRLLRDMGLKYPALVFAGLRRRLMRTVLTALSIFVAFVLLGIMNGVLSGLDKALDTLSDARLRVISRANMVAVGLPIAHRARIEALPGIVAVTPVAILPAYYQQPTNNVTAAGMDMQTLFQVFPEISLSEEEMRRVRSIRTGATVGKSLADRFGWHVGDRVPLQAYFSLNEDGGNTWTFEIVTIHNDDPGDEKLIAGELYFHYDYFNESRSEGKDTANMFLVEIEDPARAGPTAEAIDALFRNSADETQTMDEKQFLTNQLGRVGNIAAFVSAIQFAVLFTLLFIAGSTMAQSTRERTAEFGVLKAVGFSDGAVVLLIVGESFVLCLGAALLGLSLCVVLVPGTFAAMGLGGGTLGADVWLLGTGLATAMAALVSVLPALQVARLSAAEALRRA